MNSTLPVSTKISSAFSRALCRLSDILHAGVKTALNCAKLRIADAMEAFQKEKSWQAARRAARPETSAPEVKMLAGIAIDPDSGNCFFLQEGVNLFGKDFLRVDQARAEGSLLNQTAFSNDMVVIGGIPCVLKLFPPDRFSKRTVTSGEMR